MNSKILILVHTLVACFILPAQGAFFVDPFLQLSEFEGWGTSLSWWPDVLGNMPEDVIDHVTKAFFSKDGLQLNIVRYTIGGTTPGNLTCGVFRPGAMTESFLDGPDKPYNWTRDPRQRRILSIAKELGVDTFEAFSNSPPQWMTITGCSKGNPKGGVLHANFHSSQAPAFAKYIADVLEHFEKEWGIHFQTFAPFNEPYGLKGIGGWFGEKSEQEGCNMDQQTMADTIKAFHQVFLDRNVTAELSVSDETQVDTAVAVQKFFQNQGIQPLIRKVNVHGYWDSTIARRDLLHKNSVKDGHRLWMDEMGWSGSPPSDMSQGLNIATRIIKDLKVMQASAWVYWQVMENTGQWGLLSVPYENPSVENIVYKSGYFAFLQFTKYIHKGFLIVHVSDENTLAAYDPVAEKLILVVVNPTKEDNPPQDYDLGLVATINPNLFATRTSASEQDKVITGSVSFIRYGSTQQILSYAAPAESITTIVISEAKLGGTQTNLIQDGDFEDQSSSHWSPEGGASVNENENARSGNRCAQISGSGSVEQTVKVSKAGTVFVSAQCSAVSDQAQARLVVTNLNTGEVVATPVSLRVYLLYSVQLKANAGDEVVVRFESIEGDSYIDNVVAHSADN